MFRNRYCVTYYIIGLMFFECYVIGNVFFEMQNNVLLNSFFDCLKT